MYAATNLRRPIELDFEPGMLYLITPYVLISAFAAAVALIVAAIAWRRRTAPGGRPLAALMLSVSIWSAGAAMEYASIGVSEKIVWAKVQYIGVLTCSAFFLMLALEYNHLDRWLTRRNIALLFVVPTLTLALALTNDWHGLIWPSVVLIGPPEANLAFYTHGIGFWIGSVGYSYLLMLIGAGLLIRAALRFPAYYRSQAIMLVAAALAPWAVNIVYIVGLSPSPGLELTPLVLVVSGSIFAVSILRLRFLDLAPVARETLIETMSDGMVVLDVQNRVVDINPAAQRLFGAPADHLLGQPAETLFAPWAGWLACSGVPRGVVELTHAGDGRTFELTFSPLHRRRGRDPGCLIVIHDITERKATQTKIEQLNDELEARVQERTQALSESEERFRQVITSISDHVFALKVHADGSITRVYSSPRLTELSGLSAIESTEDVLAVAARMVHPDDLGRVIAYFQDMQTRSGGELEYRLVHTSGAIVWLRTNARVQTFGDDTIIFGVSSDITERKRLEKIAVENQAMAELDKLRAELVSNVSHELRTPLGLIKAASTTLLRQDVDFPSTTQQKILKGISSEADRLEQLVANLLDISKLDNNRFFLNRDQVDLNVLVTAAVDAIRVTLLEQHDASHRLVVNPSATPVLAPVDAAKIEQVLGNLLENAVRYSPEGGTVVVDVCACGGQCELRVTDQGIGIALDQQERVFDRFFRAPDVRVQRIRGAGLGLAICREIVRAHGGTLTLTSTPDEGSTFTVRLPQTVSGEDLAVETVRIEG